MLGVIQSLFVQEIPLVVEHDSGIQEIQNRHRLQLGHVPLAGWIFYGQDFISLPASHLLHPAFVMAQPPAQAGFGAQQDLLLVLSLLLLLTYTHFRASSTASQPSIPVFTDDIKILFIQMS